MQFLEMRVCIFWCVAKRRNLHKLSYDLKKELSKLKDFVFQNYDPVQISVKAMEIYSEYALQLSTLHQKNLWF